MAAANCKHAPVVIERKARAQLPAADLDERGRARLSYQQAEALSAKASGGAARHQLPAGPPPLFAKASGDPARRRTTAPGEPCLPGRT